MIDWLLIGISLAMGAGGSVEKETSVSEIKAAEPGITETRSSIYVAESQVPTGQFTTATEVRPILGVTRGSWVAVREYDGQDLLYVTHLMAWRCGLVGMRYAVNGGALQEWPLPECHIGTAAPNALLPEDGLPYVSHPLGSIQSVSIELIYDDLGTETAQFERAAVLMP